MKNWFHIAALGAAGISISAVSPCTAQGQIVPSPPNAAKTQEGSGSREEFCAIVGMKEEGENDVVHLVSFRKGESFSHQASQSLAQRAVEAFNVISIGLGLTLSELLGLYHFGIRFPDVGKTVSFFVSSRNGFP